MVNALSTFTSAPHPLGGEILLEWTYPPELPDRWKLYIFKRRTTDVTETEIENYFTALIAGTLDQFDFNGLYVNININDETQWDDFGGEKENERLKNGIKYYYKGVIFDIDNEEYSASIGTSATADRDVLTNIVDGKDVVTQAIIRVLDGQVNIKGERFSLKKYIDVFKYQPEMVDKTDWIMVRRAGGQIQYAFFNATISEFKDQIVRGDVDLDTIHVTIYSVDNPDRRDVLMNLFRAYKLAIRRYCMKSGSAIECRVVMDGDSMDPTMNNARLSTGSFTVMLLIENQIQYKTGDLLDVEIDETFKETL